MEIGTPVVAKIGGHYSPVEIIRGIYQGYDDGYKAILRPDGELRYIEHWLVKTAAEFEAEEALEQTRKNAPKPEMVKCSCGHSAPRSQVMSASMGSCCPNCYDKMSN